MDVTILATLFIFIIHNVPQYKKMGLMCTQNLTIFLNFKLKYNFALIVNKNNLIKFPPFMQHFIGNLQNTAYDRCVASRNSNWETLLYRIVTVDLSTIHWTLLAKLSTFSTK